MAKYHLLSMDGGGIRGVFTITLLQRLVEQVPGFLEKVDLVTGTSSGAFIALGLANGKTPKEIGGFFSESNLQFIFTPKHFNLYQPRYDNDHLTAVLNNFFTPGLRLNDLGLKVVIPAFQVMGTASGPWSPILFHNFLNSLFGDDLVVDTALASSAAPTYFPSYQNRIDGGVFAGNPCLAAIALAKAGDGAGQVLEDMVLLSVGSGMVPYRITADTTNWGIIQWALNPSPPPEFPLETILFDGVAEANTMFSAELLEERFYRLNPPLDDSIGLDEYEKTGELKEVAGQVNLGPVIEWVEKYWM